MAHWVPEDIRAVILAGGHGTRLRPLTAVFPKPLVPLGEKSVLEILLRRLAAFGFRHVTICTGYLRELIMAVCGDGSQFNLRVQYSYEAERLGTAGPLANLKELTDPIIVMNGDLLTTLNFAELLKHHVAREADITIGVYPQQVKIDYGVVEQDEQGRFARFKEKPTLQMHVSMGINVLSRSILQRVTPGRFLDMPDLIAQVHRDGGRVECYREACHWLDIGRMEDYALAQEQFAQNQLMFLRGPE